MFKFDWNVGFLLITLFRSIWLKKITEPEILTWEMFKQFNLILYFLKARGLGRYHDFLAKASKMLGSLLPIKQLNWVFFWTLLTGKHMCLWNNPCKLWQTFVRKKKKSSVWGNLYNIIGLIFSFLCSSFHCQRRHLRLSGTSHEVRKSILIYKCITVIVLAGCWIGSI